MLDGRAGGLEEGRKEGGKDGKEGRREGRSEAFYLSTFFLFSKICFMIRKPPEDGILIRIFMNFIIIYMIVVLFT